MQYFRGSPALSAFRIEKLLNLLKKHLPQIKTVHTEFVHFADVEGELAAAQQQTLLKLLTYGPAYKPETMTGALFLVTPRAGTISPWSSKATDIAHNCGLSIFCGWSVAWPITWNPPGRYLPMTKNL